MASLFISYSRKDIGVAKKLTGSFDGQGLDFWIDWEGIPPTVDWWKEIEKGIEEADIFLFLISPDSAKSKVCRQEIEHAAKNGKRLIPIVVRNIEADESPTELRPLNWIFIRENDDFNLGFGKLITAIKTDYEWVQAHRQLQVKALEWQRNNHENSFLLRGIELQDAEVQLATSTSKEPHPTDLQREYVLKSRQVTDRQRRITTSIAIAGAIIMAALAVFGFVQARLAEERATTARVGELAAQTIALRENQPVLSLLMGIEAFRLEDNLRTRSMLIDNLNLNPQVLQYFSGKSFILETVAFSPDGKILASAGFDKAITLWDIQTGQHIGTLQGEKPTILWSIAFSPDGKILAAGNDDNTITLWDVETLKPIGQSLSGHSNIVRDVAFSPDGKTLASASADRTIILWDAQTHQTIGQPFTGHSDIIYSIAFSPDGMTLASGSVDHTVMLWDVRTHQTIGKPLMGHTDWVKSVAFSPDGSMVASGSVDKTIVLWDVQS